MNDPIDDVARQMTAAAPPDGAAFRRRVLARIDSGDAPQRIWRPSFVLTPIAVAAAIIVTLFVARDRGPRDRRPGPSGPGGITAPMAQTPRSLPAADAAGPNGPALRITAAAHIRRPGPSGRGVREPEPQRQPNDVASIAVAPLAVDTLSPGSIHVEQLDPVASIAVAPLDINDPSRRNP